MSFLHMTVPFRSLSCDSALDAREKLLYNIRSESSSVSVLYVF